MARVKYHSNDPLVAVDTQAGFSTAAWFVEFDHTMNISENNFGRQGPPFLCDHFKKQVGDWAERNNVKLKRITESCVILTNQEDALLLYLNFA